MIYTYLYLIHILNVFNWLLTPVPQLAFLVLRAPWNSLSQIFGGEATWMASFGGRIVSAPHVSHTFPRFLEGKSSNPWRDAHVFFCCGICLNEWISYSISSDLLSLLRDGSSRSSNPTRSPERLHLIISDSVQGLGRDGLQLPPIDVPARSLMSLKFSAISAVELCNKCFLEWGYTSSSFICRYFPSTTTYYKVRNLEGHLRDFAQKIQQAVISAEYSCNFEKRFKKAPKPSSFSKGNACFVRCCSWMDIPPRWWTFYAWPLLGRELMGRHCKGC